MVTPTVTLKPWTLVYEVDAEREPLEREYNFYNKCPTRRHLHTITTPCKSAEIMRHLETTAFSIITARAYPE